MRRLLPALVLACIGSGCATTSGLAPQESVSGFDQQARVSIAGHGAACKSMACTGLGASWSAEHKTQAVLTAYVFNQVVGITGAALNIDGQTVDLGRPAQLTNFDTAAGTKISRQDFLVPLQTIREAYSAKRV